MSDRNEWFKDVKRLIRGLEVETVEDPFACPTVKSVTDGEDVLHALGLHPSRDVCGIVNVDIDEVYRLIRHIEPEPVTGSTSDGYHTFDELEITTVRTYRTKRRIEDMPDGWNGGELQ